MGKVRKALEELKKKVQLKSQNKADYERRHGKVAEAFRGITEEYFKFLDFSGEDGGLHPELAFYVEKKMTLLAKFRDLEDLAEDEGHYGKAFIKLDQVKKDVRQLHEDIAAKVLLIGDLREQIATGEFKKTMIDDPGKDLSQNALAAQQSLDLLLSKVEDIPEAYAGTASRIDVEIEHLKILISQINTVPNMAKQKWTEKKSTYDLLLASHNEKVEARENPLTKVELGVNDDGTLKQEEASLNGLYNDLLALAKEYDKTVKSAVKGCKKIVKNAKNLAKQVDSIKDNALTIPDLELNGEAVVIDKRSIPGFESPKFVEKQEEILADIKDKIDRGKSLIDELGNNPPNFDPDNGGIKNPPGREDLADLLWYLKTMAEVKVGEPYEKGALTIPDPDNKIFKYIISCKDGSKIQTYPRSSSHMVELQDKSNPLRQPYGVDFYDGDLGGGLDKLIPFGMNTALMQAYPIGGEERLYLKMETEGARISVDPDDLKKTKKVLKDTWDSSGLIGKTLMGLGGIGVGAVAGTVAVGGVVAAAGTALVGSGLGALAGLAKCGYKSFTGDKRQSVKGYMTDGAVDGASTLVCALAAPVIGGDYVYSKLKNLRSKLDEDYDPDKRLSNPKDYVDSIKHGLNLLKSLTGKHGDRLGGYREKIAKVSTLEDKIPGPVISFYQALIDAAGKDDVFSGIKDILEAGTWKKYVATMVGNIETATEEFAVMADRNDALMEEYLESLEGDPDAEPPEGFIGMEQMEVVDAMIKALENFEEILKFEYKAAGLSSKEITARIGGEVVLTDQDFINSLSNGTYEKILHDINDVARYAGEKLEQVSQDFGHVNTNADFVKGMVDVVPSADSLAILEEYIAIGSDLFENAELVLEAVDDIVREVTKDENIDILSVIPKVYDKAAIKSALGPKAKGFIQEFVSSRNRTRADIASICRVHLQIKSVVEAIGSLLASLKCKCQEKVIEESLLSPRNAGFEEDKTLFSAKDVVDDLTEQLSSFDNKITKPLDDLLGLGGKKLKGFFTANKVTIELIKTDLADKDALDDALAMNTAYNVEIAKFLALLTAHVSREKSIADLITSDQTTADPKVLSVDKAVLKFSATYKNLIERTEEAIIGYLESITEHEIELNTFLAPTVV